MNTPVESNPAQRIYEPLKDGFVLRQAIPADKDKLIEFNSIMHNTVSGAEVKFLLDGLDPHFQTEDFLVVVDSQERIISSLCLMEVEWRLGNTLIRFGQPEFVGTLAEYRGRGLVRRQFEILHRWMKERGLAFGLIGGIEYYYRLFGYEYGVDILHLGRLKVEEHATKIKMPDGVEVRPITEADIETLERLSAERDSQFDLTSIPAKNSWRWAVETHHLETVEVENWLALKDGQPIGSARTGGKPENRYIGLFTGNEMAAQALIATALAQPKASRLRVIGQVEMTNLSWLKELAPEPLRSDAWYIRINDSVLALEKLASELERRIEASSFAGLNQEVELGCYRFNLGLIFEEGKLKRVERRSGQQEPKIGIPPDLLPKLLMGWREIEELAYMYPDLIAGTPQDWQMLKVLFPRLKSYTRFYL